MYKTGAQVEAQQFSHKNIGEMLTVYSANSQWLTNHRWKQIMTSYGVGSNEKQSAAFNEQQFCDLYTPSSP